MLKHSKYSHNSYELCYNKSKFTTELKYSMRARWLNIIGSPPTERTRWQASVLFKNMVPELRKNIYLQKSLKLIR